MGTKYGDGLYNSEWGTGNGERGQKCYRASIIAHPSALRCLFTAIEVRKMSRGKV
ncbi:hypothetical protein Cal7507_1226 [Calothrix sp. PCC 7507]|nr:hypothetical protein Cal7507_1226 [Calothrix sp. PCC 7507]